MVERDLGTVQEEDRQLAVVMNGEKEAWNVTLPDSKVLLYA